MAATRQDTLNDLTDCERQLQQLTHSGGTDRAFEQLTSRMAHLQLMLDTFPEA